MFLCEKYRLFISVACVEFFVILCQVFIHKNFRVAVVQVLATFISRWNFPMHCFSRTQETNENRLVQLFPPAKWN